MQKKEIYINVEIILYTILYRLGNPTQGHICPSRHDKVLKNAYEIISIH